MFPKGWAGVTCFMADPIILLFQEVHHIILLPHVSAYHAQIALNNNWNEGVWVQHRFPQYMQSMPARETWTTQTAAPLAGTDFQTFRKYWVNSGKIRQLMSSFHILLKRKHSLRRHSYPVICVLEGILHIAVFNWICLLSLDSGMCSFTLAHFRQCSINITLRILLVRQRNFNKN